MTANREPVRARTAEELAAERVLRLRHAAESAATAAERLSELKSRATWKEEKSRLEAKRIELVAALSERQADAAASDAAAKDYATAEALVDAVTRALEEAPMPRAVPPVSGEVEAEAAIRDRSANPDDVFAWAAGLSSGERTALERRLSSVEGGSRARGEDEDVFAVALAGYLAQLRVLYPFRRVLQNPRHFDRRAYEQARSQRAAGTPAPADDAIAMRDDGAEGIFDDITPAEQLPHRAEMERTFGKDFSAVRARTGAAELRAEGVEAVARGNEIVFADAQPSPELTAHELTHVLQQEGAGTTVAAASGQNSDQGTPDECEAREVAEAVCRGEPASSVPITATPTAMVQRSPDVDGTAPHGAGLRGSDDPPRPASVEDAEWRRLLAGARMHRGDLDAIIAQSPPLRSALAETMRAVEEVAGEDYAYTVSFKLMRHGLQWESSRERRGNVERGRYFAAQETDRQIAERERDPALAGRDYCDITEGVNKQQGKVAGAVALSYLQEIQGALLPAFRAAVDALDTSSAYSIATVLLHGLRESDRALRGIESALALPVVAPTTGDASSFLDQNALLLEHAHLVQRIAEVLDLLSRQVGPTMFRGEAILGVAGLPLGRNPIATIEAEASTTLALLATIDAIRDVAPDARPGQCVALSDEQRLAIGREIEPWHGRPINFAFLRSVLEVLCIWEEVAPSSLVDEERVADNQARFGVFADVGEYEHANVVELLSRSKWKSANGAFDTDAADTRRAKRVFERIASAAPDARAKIILELAETRRERGDGTCFDALMRYLPWQWTSELATLVLQGHGPETRRAFGLIQPHYVHKGEETTIKDVVGDGLFAEAYDVLTAGAMSEINAAQEAARDGWMGSGEAMEAQVAAGGRGVAMTAVAGAFGEVGGVVAARLANRFGAEGLLALVGRGALIGGASGVGGQLGADVLDQAAGIKNGWSSPGDYATAGALGASMGILAAGVSVAAGRYLPPEQRTPPQRMAADHPQYRDVIDVLARNAGGTVKIRIPRRRAADLSDRGIIAGGIPAYEGGAPPPGGAIVGAADDVIVVEVAVDPQLGAAGGPLGQYVFASRLDEPEDVYDYIEGGSGRRASYPSDDELGYDEDGVIDLMGSSPEVAAVRSVDAQTAGLDRIYSRPNFRPGLREDVYEQARRSSKDGIVRDPVTGEEIPFDSDWQMGHVPGWEFRKHQRSAARRHLTREEFVDEYNDPTHYRPETPETNRSHIDEAPDHIDHWADAEESY